MLQNLSSAAVVIGALRVKWRFRDVHWDLVCCLYSDDCRHNNMMTGLKVLSNSFGC